MTIDTSCLKSTPEGMLGSNHLQTMVKQLWKCGWVFCFDHMCVVADIADEVFIMGHLLCDSFGLVDIIQFEEIMNFRGPLCF